MHEEGGRSVRGPRRPCLSLGGAGVVSGGPSNRQRVGGTQREEPFSERQQPEVNREELTNSTCTSW